MNSAPLSGAAGELSEAGRADPGVAHEGSGATFATDVSDTIRFDGRLSRHTPDLVLRTDLAGHIEAANQGACDVLGYALADLVGTNIFRYVAPAGVAAGKALIGRVVSTHGACRDEIEHLHRDGSSVFLDIILWPVIVDGEITGIEGIGRDVSEQHALRAELTHQSFHDRLTGLPNRALCVDRIDQALARGARTGLRLAVALLDVDEFKLVNDSVGHAAGDEILIELAARLTSALRTNETIARMGGDEFVVVAEDLVTDAAVAELGDRITAVFTAPFSVAGSQRALTGSLGIAVSELETTTSDLLRDADTAMYRIKASSKGAVGLFDPGLRNQFLHDIALASGLGDAVRDGHLDVYYQPIVGLDDGRVLAVEALARWLHPEWGWVEPGEFIPVAENTGLIVRLGKLVLREAVRQAAQWRALRPSSLPLGVFVNVSPRELSEAGFVPFVAATLQEFGLEPSDLGLEVTESVVIDDRGEVVLENVHALARLGVRLVIDDFGTGYSALSSLRRFPFAALKIDRDFIDEIDTPNAKAPIISALVALAKTLRMMVIAEGVETQMQRDYLRRLGCDAVQGFGVGRPRSATATWTRLCIEPAETSAGPEAPEASAGASVRGGGVPAPIPLDERERVAALRSCDVLDTEPEAEFDEIAQMAAEICGTQMSFVSLVDRDREYLKAAVGSNLREAPRATSFCGHAILNPDVSEVRDTLSDPRFASNPDVTGGNRIRFYAGAPVITSDGFAVGMLCVKDTAPRELSETQRHALTVLAHQVAAQLELRRLRAPRAGTAARARPGSPAPGAGRARSVFRGGGDGSA
jgi:diguanylate cyclase (GGDEF)-like protein/PAS domain S-box-containing protein